MTLPEIARCRLQLQHLRRPLSGGPEDVVRTLLAVQAQDYYGARWSIAQRAAGLGEAALDRAIASGAIVRSWPMRGTLHFVAGADLRWMLRLLGPRVIASAAGRHRALGLEQDYPRSRRALLRALERRGPMIREELYAVMRAQGIAPEQQRGLHVLQRMSMEGLLCLASHRGKQPAYALLDQWVKPAAVPQGEEALALLAERYIAGHGPATDRDLAWWAGLRLADARRALAAASGLRECRAGEQRYWMPEGAAVPGAGTKAWLLPGFDEFLLGYADRSAAVSAADQPRLLPGKNGLFLPTLVVDGRVVGTWTRSLRPGAPALEMSPFRPLGARPRQALAAAARRLQAYLAAEPGNPPEK